MRLKTLLPTIFFFFSHNLAAQQTINVLILDSSTKQHLPFASIRLSNLPSGYLSDINGKLSLKLNEGITSITISYTGYTSKKIQVSTLKNIDTVFLIRKSSALKEVIITSNNNKITRIINAAIANKYANNPDNYNKYECNIYYKMKVEVTNFPQDSFHYDSNTKKKVMDSVKQPLPDFFTDKSFLMLGETYSKRLYQKPQKINEIVLASRFSGLQKTYFINTITQVLPFHVYNDYIKLNEVDYSNPISRGWQSRYKFILEDEIFTNADTTYIFSFLPKKNVLFNSLRGTVFINKNGYAISHIIASTADTSKDRVISFEQLYSLVNNKWFPKELNYSLSIKKVFSPQTVIWVNGHSIVDSVFINKPLTRNINNAHPLQLSDSVDMISADKWAILRLDSLSTKEANTYIVVDSFSKKIHLEKLLQVTSKLQFNKIEIGKLDLDLNRIYSRNEFEGSRFGIGLSTNNKISKYYSIGGYLAYGLKDNKVKGGSSFTLFPKANKDNWISFSALHDYRKPGLIYLFDDNYKRDGLKWVLRNPDVINEYKVSFQQQAGFSQINPELLIANITTSPVHLFFNNGTSYNNFVNKEINVGVRYAYGEKRIPVLDYYVPLETKYPILYLRFAYGSLQSYAYTANYYRLLTSVAYKHHFNRWGNDAIKVDGGYINSFNKSLPRSFLFGTNGFRINKVSYAFQDGFATIAPDQYFSDVYLNIFYKHDFDKFIWEKKYSKPFFSLLHNLAWGTLSSASAADNPGTITFTKPYHETGMIINQILKYNFHLVEIGLNIGAFHHWNRPETNQNNTFVFSFGAIF